jgi:hypothetical protein
MQALIQSNHKEITKLKTSTENASWFLPTVIETAPAASNF